MNTHYLASLMQSRTDQSMCVYNVDSVQLDPSLFSRGTIEDGFSGQFFRIFEIIFFCCVVEICDIVKYANCSFMGITHIQ